MATLKRSGSAAVQVGETESAAAAAAEKAAIDIPPSHFAKEPRAMRSHSSNEPDQTAADLTHEQMLRGALAGVALLGLLAGGHPVRCQSINDTEPETKEIQAAAYATLALAFADALIYQLKPR